MISVHAPQSCRTRARATCSFLWRAILLDETGQFQEIGVPRGTVRNAVGAGDSMVAGFLAGYLKLGTYSYALRMGAAAGSATAFSDELATKEEILKLLNTF